MKSRSAWRHSGYFIRRFAVSPFSLNESNESGWPTAEKEPLMDSWLVCYDISNPKRLRKVATVCEDFGVRKQFSVFLCRLSATDLVRLRSRLYDVLDLRADQVLFIPLCQRCVHQIDTLGRPMEAVDARDVVVVV